MNPIAAEPSCCRAACRHALGWLVAGNLVGCYLALLLLFPQLQCAALTYGRWVPVHLNVQLYGWTSLPLIAWLFDIYQVDHSRMRRWGVAVVAAWSVALAAGACSWLAGTSSGKIFLDWKGGCLWGFVLAQVMLWCVLALAWFERRGQWSRMKCVWTAAGLLSLMLVPASLVMASSPAVYPPVDVSTGGPTGASLLGSTLVVIGLMLMLPRVMLPGSGPLRWVGGYYLFCWLWFAVAEWLGGTHFGAVQLSAMACLLPWAWLLPRDWAAAAWPEATRGWRAAALACWALLVLSGLVTYLPGVLDHSKFTQALVAHSHLAMAGFTTSFCLLVITALGETVTSRCSQWLWHGAVLAMILVLATMGWLEGKGYAWMIEPTPWRVAGFALRALCGGLMLWVSVVWWHSARRS